MNFRFWQFYDHKIIRLPPYYLYFIYILTIEQWAKNVNHVKKKIEEAQIKKKTFRSDDQGNYCKYRIRTSDTYSDINMNYLSDYYNNYFTLLNNFCCLIHK